MSRIEEALAKAAQLRSSQTPAAPAGKSVLPPHLPPQVATENIQVTNQLLVMASAPNTPAAEEYRKLKSIIVKQTKGDHFRNMLMVTSSIGGEGKTVTALNLAISLAQEYDHTVLLVDADIRKPSIGSYLGIGSRAGISECLLDGLELKDALIRTGIGKLSFLPAGREVRNPAELFSSQRMKDFLIEIKNRYYDRYIIIDTPPVLPFAETRSLSAIVDGAVLVVKEGLVSLPNITETMDCLKGTNMLGIVYNGATMEQHSERYQYYRQGNA